MLSFFLRILIFIKHILFSIGGGIKKVVGFKRKRKVLAEDNVPTSVVVVPKVANISTDPVQTYDTAQSNSYSLNAEECQQDWGNWDATGINSSNSPSSTSAPAVADEIAPEPEIDFFKDMEPTVKVKKVLVRKKVNTATTSNRLAMDQDLDFKVSGDLEDWKDEDGWSGDDSDQLNIDEAEILREAQKQRRLERQMRAKQQKLHKSLKPHDKLGLKVS